jgi:hypothetical protein
LKKKDIDIRLPYSWYYFGNLIEPQTFGDMTGASLGYYAPDKGNLQKIIDIPHFDIASDILKTIDYTVLDQFSEITENNHYKKEYGQILLKKTYSKAPFEFQRLFNRGLFPFVNNFKPQTGGQSTLTPLIFDDSDIRKINDYLDLLIVNYPKEGLPEIYDNYLEWDDTVRLAITNDHSQIIPLTGEFCKFYCGLLRIKENENILPEVIQRWTDEFYVKIYPEYLENIEKMRMKLLDSHFSAHPAGDKTKEVVDKIMVLARDLSIEERTNGV